MSLARVGLQWNYELAKLAPHNVHVLIETGLAYWSTDEGPIYDASITPVFRYARSRNGPYGEAAIGLHILSDTYIQPNVTFSTALPVRRPHRRRPGAGDSTTSG